MGKCPIGLDLWYEVSVHDLKTGKRVRHKKARCYSFVQQFAYLLRSYMANSPNIDTALDTSNTSRTLNPMNYGISIFDMTAASTDTTHGSVVGTSSTAAAITDVALGTKIAHGTSSGQLQYSAVTFGAPSTDSTSTSFIVTRVFTNGSGGSIGVNEIGLISQCSTTASTRQFLIARDVVSTITVSNGQALTLNYTLKTTV